MRVNSKHHLKAEKLLTSMRTKEIREVLISEGLTKAQASNVVRCERKRAKLWYGKKEKEAFRKRQQEKLRRERYEAAIKG
jgi:hypothetical protein